MTPTDHTDLIEAFVSVNGPGPYWPACHHPERPADRWTLWDTDCPACFVHLQAAAHITPDAACGILDGVGGGTTITRAAAYTNARDERWHP